MSIVIKGDWVYLFLNQIMFVLFITENKFILFDGTHCS